MAEEICLDSLLHCLLKCSEKAARIAQVFREENEVFHLLVEEKSEIEKNKRFVQDFKTLADVLVQETIKKDVGKKFPAIISKIQGEEQNKFQNTLGESIDVEITESSEDTTNLLCKVLNGKQELAESLASVVHSKNVDYSEEFHSSMVIPANKIGIWIDPIDSTAEYIQAKHDETNKYGIQQYGLKCVCVLIGVYHSETGNPILGIINQPFFCENATIPKWKTNIYWGINYESEKIISATLNNHNENKEKIILISSSEEEELKKIMHSKYTVIHAAGAGYKCLLVACKKADLYVLSQGTTYFWDTCGPHAVLKAEGGGILNFQHAVNASEMPSDLQHYEIKYFPDNTQSDINPFKNSNGILAYRDVNDAVEFLHLLRNSGYKFQS